MCKPIQVTAAIVMSAALVLGCSSSSNNDSSETSMQGGEGGGGGGSNSSFNGNWTVACDDFEVVNFTINGTSASSETFSYTDEACTLPDTPAVTRTTVSIAYPGGTTSTDQGVATHVNVTTEEILFDGVPPDADELALLQQFGAFDVEYDLALISNGMLLFGEFTNERDGSSAAMRPNTMDLDFPAVRQ